MKAGGCAWAEEAPGGAGGLEPLFPWELEPHPHGGSAPAVLPLGRALPWEGAPGEGRCE